MTKKEFYNIYIKDWLEPNDKPANRQLWTNTLDSAFDNGDITQKQVNTWIYPKNKYFV